MLFRRRVTHTASEARLEKLIADRLEPAADREEIDRRIWDLFGEERCVMVTDLAGFSRRVAEFGIIHFLQTIHESERILVPVIEVHDGILLKVEGDSFLVIFRNAQKALRAAIEMQKTTLRYNQAKMPEEHVLLCVGLGFGRVLRIGDADVFGPEVNAASKLGEDIACAHEILVTQAVKDAAILPGVEYEEIDEVPPGAARAYRLKYGT
jgi:class 3 adenylate cyclase